MRNTDKGFMRRALFLSRRDGIYAPPNPKVGAVLVKGGVIVGEGAHSHFGGPHAEILALREAGSKARGATLYVTLEPCCHHGKTPPCADAVLRSGVKRVVAAMRDPFPLVSGGGFGRLRKAGVKVEVGLLRKEARFLNRDFLYSVTHGLPKVILKAAMSLDGKIAAVTGRSRWITGKEARKEAHELRSRVDAILVGSRTARMDDPSLTVRVPGFKRKDGYPIRVLLDSDLRTPLRSRVFQGAPMTLVFASRKAPVSREKALRRKGVRVFRVPQIGKMLSLKAILRVLHAFPVRTLLVEGGGETIASFLKERLAQEAVLFISPKILGGKAVSWVEGEGVRDPNRAPTLRKVKVRKVGKDILVEGSFEF